MSFVYALGALDSSLIKIGWTKGSVQQRVAALQPGSPLLLKVLWAQPGALSVEQHLHGTFSNRRLHNEWFDFTDADALALLEAAYTAYGTERQAIRRAGKGIRLYGDECERLYQSGETLRNIGSKIGITAEYVRQILRDMGVPTAAIRQRFTEQRTSDRSQAKVLAAMQRAISKPPCRVCGAWVIRGGDTTTTCSYACADIWATARYQLDDTARANHRRIVAQRIVNNPALARNDRQLEYARAVLSDNPPPPNRRWVGPNSRVRQALTAAGIDPPPNGGRSRVLSYPCSAINRNGSPCSRHVDTEGARCHIHLGLHMKKAS